MMDFDDPLLPSLGISIDFLVTFLLDQLVAAVVQISNEGVNRGRGWNRRDHCCPIKRDYYGIPSAVIAVINRLQKAIPAVVIVAVFIMKILTSQTEVIFERECVVMGFALVNRTRNAVFLTR